MPAYINVDAQDPERITQFWCQLLGVEVQGTWEDGNYVQLEPAKALGGLMLIFQRVPDPKVGKNRVHWDLHVDDLDSGTAQVEALGGRWTEPGKPEELMASSGASWRTRMTTSSAFVRIPRLESQLTSTTAQCVGQASKVEPRVDPLLAIWDTERPKRAPNYR